MLHQDRLHFPGGDVLATGDDHVVGPPQHSQGSVRLQPPEIGGREPLPGGPVVLAGVAGRYLRTAHLDAAVVGDAHLDPGEGVRGPPGRGPGAQRRHLGTGLGHPVGGEGRDPAGMGPLDQARGDGSSTHQHRPQAREAAGVAVEDPAQDGGDEGGDGDPGPQSGHHLGRARPGHPAHPGPDIGAPVEDGETAHVVHRHHRQPDVVGPVFEMDGRGLHRRPPVGLGQADGPGRTGAAGGEHHGRGRLGGCRRRRLHPAPALGSRQSRVDHHQLATRPRHPHQLVDVFEA